MISLRTRSPDAHRRMLHVQREYVSAPAAFRPVPSKPRLKTEGLAFRPMRRHVRPPPFRSCPTNLPVRPVRQCLWHLIELLNPRSRNPKTFPLRNRRTPRLNANGLFYVLGNGYETLESAFFCERTEIFPKKKALGVKSTPKRFHDMLAAFQLRPYASSPTSARELRPASYRLKSFSPLNTARASATE